MKPGENVIGANVPQGYALADNENTNSNENQLGTNVPQVNGGTFDGMGLSGVSEFIRWVSLLRAICLTEVPNIGEVNEDDVSSIEPGSTDGSSMESQESLKRLSFSSMKTNEITSIQSRSQSRLSKRGSTCSNLDDLALVYEIMAFEDSGIFSCDETEISQLEKEMTEWEKEAEIEDSKDIQEEVNSMVMWVSYCI